MSEIKKIKLNEIKKGENYREFSSVDDLILSLLEIGQKSEIKITKNYVLINGYRRFIALSIISDVIKNCISKEEIYSKYKINIDEEIYQHIVDNSENYGKHNLDSVLVIVDDTITPDLNEMSIVQMLDNEVSEKSLYYLAKMIKKLVDNNYKQTTLANMLGKSKGWLSRIIKLVIDNNYYDALLGGYDFYIAENVIYKTQEELYKKRIAPEKIKIVKGVGTRNAPSLWLMENIVNLYNNIDKNDEEQIRKFNMMCIKLIISKATEKGVIENAVTKLSKELKLYQKETQKEEKKEIKIDTAAKNISKIFTSSVFSRANLKDLEKEINTILESEKIDVKISITSINKQS